MTPVDRLKKLFNNPATIAFLALVFLLPMGAVTVQHWSTSIAYLLILIGLFRCWKQPHALDKYEKAIIAGFIIFFCVACLSLVNSADLHQSVKRLGKLIWFIGFIPIYLAFHRFQVNPALPFLTALILAAPINLAVALYQVEILGWTRAVGAYNPILMGTMAVITILVGSAALATNVIGRKYIFLVLVSLACSLYVCILSGTKTSWLTLLLTIPLLLWLLRKKISRKQLVIFLLSLSLCIVPLFLGTRAILEKRMDEFVNGVTDSIEGDMKDLSVGIRIRMWKTALGIWSENPILGTGLGDFYIDIKQHQAEGTVSFVMPPSKAHSIYFESLAVTGIVGFFTMLGALFIFPFRFFIHYWNKSTIPEALFPALSGIMCLATYAVLGLTQSWLTRNYNVVPFILYLAVFMTACKKSEAMNKIV